MQTAADSTAYVAKSLFLLLNVYVVRHSSLFTFLRVLPSEFRVCYVCAATYVWLLVVLRLFVYCVLICYVLCFSAFLILKWLIAACVLNNMCLCCFLTVLF